MEIKGLHIIPEPIIQKQQSSQQSGKNAPKNDFQEILGQKLISQSEIQISQHARKRLQQKNIELGERDLQNIARAMNQAQNKGVRESLLIYGDLAMVASIKNKTIVTALLGQEGDDKVFTNIDGAILVGKH